MASDLTGGELSAREEPAPQAEPTGKRVPFTGIPHWHRFYLIYLVLGLVLFAAIAGGIVFGRQSLKPKTAWSAWRPIKRGEAGLVEIASHVGAEYRLPHGAQADDVIAKAPTISQNGKSYPIGYIAITGTKRQPDSYVPISSANSVLFTLCGLGPSCSIASGKPSVTRTRFLRREALDLALYTFRYESGITDVLAALPPNAQNAASVLVYFHRSDLQSLLDVPLGHSLAPKTPLPSTMTLPDRTMVNAVTKSRQYTWTVTTAQDGNQVVVLTPLAA